MDDNDVKLLNSSKTSVTIIGKWMNLFSIFAVIGILFIAIAGLFLLYYSSTLPEDMAHYIDNIVGLSGIGLIVVAGFLVPAVVRLRKAVHAAREIKVTGELYPVPLFLRDCGRMWHYMAWLLVALIIFSAICALMLSIYFLPTLSTIN